MRRFVDDLKPALTIKHVVSILRAARDLEHCENCKRTDCPDECVEKMSMARKLLHAVREAQAWPKEQTA